MHSRPDLDTFVAGELYRHSDTDEIVEFIGVATVPEMLGEDVAVFRWARREGGCLIATQQSYLAGETFQPLGEAIDDDTDLDL